MAEEPKEEAPRLVGREEVIEFSRRRHGTPRAEVERCIAKQMGWPTPEELAQQLRDRLLHRLQGVGVTERQAKYLLATYSLDRIQQQLDWLPFRQSTRNPAAFIVAAIRRNYEPPEGLYVDQGSKGRQASLENLRASTERDPDTERKPNKE